MRQKLVARKRLKGRWGEITVGIRGGGSLGSRGDVDVGGYETNLL